MAAGTLTFDNGRLPGVVCAPGLPARDAPLRLDVPGFVGFAERGPLDTPVPLEDVNQYRAVFGGDVLLAQDDGKPVYAHLPTAVRAFFDNGGTRCHVVRVAPEGAAATARFEIPGLRMWSAAEGDLGDAVVSAAWPGAWANRMRVGTTVLRQPLAVGDGAYNAGLSQLPVTRATAAMLRAGDVLRLTGPNNRVVFVVVDAVLFAAAGPLVRVGAAVPGSLANNAPGNMSVKAAELIRFDIDVFEVGRVERWEDLSCARAWLDVLQPGGSTAPESSGRSLRLRGPDVADDVVFIPAGLAGRAPAPLTNEGADGLDAFDPVSAFLDDDLRDASSSELVSEVERLTVLSRAPRRLRGVHALAAVDEVAMIAVPDAVHRAWDPLQPAPVAPDVEAEPEEPRDWTRFDPCAVPEPEDVVEAPPPPEPTAADLPVLAPTAAFDPAPLFDVQRAVVRLCAARADAVALLSLPAHFDATGAAEWRQQFTADPSLGPSALSYAAAWHPWLGLRDGRAEPPDGHVAGTIAEREHAAGAWAAAANMPMAGVVSLRPALSTQDLTRVFDLYVNPVVQKPRKFVGLSAHTLSPDPHLLQLSVRRLLILLRRLALVLGDRWVFEPNNDAFRSRVRSAFERLLSRLQARGALVAFLVVMPEGEAARIDADNGRFIVELRVAPTSPIEFITVTLVRNREGVLDLLEA